MPLNAPAFLANGNISPSRFVKQDTGASEDFMVIQTTAATDHIIGVAQDGTKQPPGVTGSDAFAAHALEAIQVYGPGDVCLLKIGSGGCTRGDYLKSDGSGQGITCAFTLGANTIFTGAIALETANNGDLARVLVLIQAQPNVTA